MLPFVDGCRARLDSAQLTTAHCETCYARRNKLSGRDGVVKISSGGRCDGGGGHDNRKRERETGEACCGVCDFKSPVFSK